MEPNNLYCGRAEQLINELQDGSIDLVVTSPPYNVDLGNNKYNKEHAYDCHDDNMTHEDYMRWLTGIFWSLYLKMKPGGRICINVGDSKNGAVPTHSDIIQAMKGIGYLPLTTIHWNKGSTSNRAAWGSYLSPSSPSCPSPMEYIMVFAKDSRKLLTKGETDLTREEFIAWAYGVWNFPGATTRKKGGHPAPFPEELPKRLIKLFSWKDALVLDPFNGSGTTTKVAKDLGRNWIGFDKSEGYVGMAKERMGLE
jgi:site-specific DNA-methyltransferase (adenine-specific)